MAEVVVGVDGSELSSIALERAADEAERRGGGRRGGPAWQTPVWAVPPLATAPPPPDPEACASWARGVADAAVADLRRRHDIRCPVSTEAEHGAPAGALVRAAAGADLLVVGGRAHGRLAEVLLGSVTDELLRTSPAPLMLVPTSTFRSGFRRVLVGTDGSPHAHAALRHAAAVAARDGVPLVVVRCWMLTNLPEHPPAPYVPSLDELGREVEARVRQEVAAHVPDTVQAELRVLHAPASESLLQQVHEGDLLVLGARGTGGFEGLLLGSVADQCARHTRVPVVIVR